MLFLDAKSIVGARGHEVTPLQRVVIAIQACVLVLNLDASYYDGWENVIVYPDEFMHTKEQTQSAAVQTATFGSDAIADLLRALHFDYIALTPGASFRGLHASP